MNPNNLIKFLFVLLMLVGAHSSWAQESEDDPNSGEQQEEGVTEETSILDKLFQNLEGENPSDEPVIDEQNIEIRVEDPETAGSFKSGANINLIDKTLGKLYKLEIPTNTRKTVKEVSIRVNKCFSPDSKTLLPEGKALIEVYENVNGKNYRIFYGWMFAQSASAASLNHNKWDITLKSCFAKAGSAESSTKSDTSSSTESNSNEAKPKSEAKQEASDIPPNNS